MARIDGIDVVPGARLADLTTLRIGGRPRALLECADAEAVVAAVRALDAADVPVLVLGGGSNLVVAGGDLDLVVVALRNREISYVSGGGDHQLVVRAGAGLTWEDLVADTVARGYGGLECLSGIPGSVGATPVQNVGAYGVEVAQVLHRVRWLDRATGVDEWVAPDALGLAYRTSVLKNSDRAVVLEVEFRLDPAGRSEPIRYAELAGRLGVAPGERTDPAVVRRTVLELRRGKGMVLDDDDEDTWSAGSFFTNPVIGEDELPTVRSRVAGRLGSAQAEQMPAFSAPGGIKLSAGWLIERAGFSKGHPSSSSPARLSTKHALALTNRGSATADDVIALAREVRDGVREAFGVELYPEPVWVGCSI
ncbi:UDP-N-acetylmuramate dehydrogenase [Dietzia sp. 111N12-1]|uniref:UDP-N-acetylmuramate dehydrogenase n=1 Tax=Dietzia sp. 111N12-1 TaxID=1785156 RepID=UPI00352C6DBE